jgi:hypothetical protein
MNQIARTDWDEHLQQLAISAQQHAPLTPERQQALTQLVNGILRSGRLCRPQRGQFLAVYDDIYDEACQNLMLYICQQIHKYDPQRGNVLAWCNVLLERRFFKEAIPKVLDHPSVGRATLVDLDQIPTPESSPTLTELIWTCIETDPTHQFKREHLKHHPSVNFQALARRRLAGQRWYEIANEFGVNLPTISSFYYQSIKKFSAVFRTYCSEHDS